MHWCKDCIESWYVFAGKSADDPRAKGPDFETASQLPAGAGRSSSAVETALSVHEAGLAFHFTPLLICYALSLLVRNLLLCHDAQRVGIIKLRKLSFAIS